MHGGNGSSNHSQLWRKLAPRGLPLPSCNAIAMACRTWESVATYFLWLSPYRNRQETQTQAKGVRSAKGRESDSEPTRSESKGEARRVVRFGLREAEPLTGRGRSGEAGKWGGVGTLGEQGVQVALRVSVRRSFTSHSFVHSFTHSYVYLLTH